MFELITPLVNVSNTPWFVTCSTPQEVEIIKTSKRIKTNGGLKFVAVWVPEHQCFWIFEPYSGIYHSDPKNWMDHQRELRKFITFTGSWERGVIDALKSGIGKPGSNEADRIAIEEWILDRAL